MLPNQAAVLLFSPPTPRVQPTVPSQWSFRRCPLLHYTAIFHGILLALELPSPNGLSSSNTLHDAWPFYIALSNPSQDHPWTPGIRGTLLSWIRSCTSVRNTVLLFLKSPCHTFQQCTSHTSWHPIKLGKSQSSSGILFSRSCKILKAMTAAK